MLKRWLPSLLGLGGIAIAGRLLGFVRDALMAAKFGVTDATDAYLTSYIIMDILIAANAAVLAGTLSYYGQNEKGLIHDRKGIQKFTLKVFIVSAAVVLLTGVLLNFVLKLAGPANSEYNHIFKISSDVLLLTAPFLIVSGVYSALHQMNGEMLFPGKLSIFMNVLAIISIFLIKDSFGVISIPIGLLLGVIIFHFYQIFHPSLKKLFTATPDNFSIKVSVWAGIVLLIFLNSFLANIVGFLERYFSLQLAKGTFSYYSYAARLFLLPLSFFGYAISTSLLPFQVKAKSEGDAVSFNEALSKGLTAAVIAAGFCFMIFFTLNDSIVKLVYQRGEISINDSQIISGLLLILSIGVFPYLISPVIGNTYYALGLTKYMVINGLITIAAQTGLLLFFTNYYFDGRALAISSAVVSWFSFLNLIIFLGLKKAVRMERSLFGRFLIFSILIMCFAGAIKYFMPDYVFSGGQTGNENFLYLVLAGFGIAVIFTLLVSLVFKKSPADLLSLFGRNKN
ncbi:MAG: murein biosynthesis integral membrane protein MurJ [Ignavibacteriaceae bacterium]